MAGSACVAFGAEGGIRIRAAGTGPLPLKDNPVTVGGKVGGN
jgi:hypothetical protein